jgi:hypothetical protein
MGGQDKGKRGTRGGMEGQETYNLGGIPLVGFSKSLLVLTIYPLPVLTWEKNYLNF